MSSLSLNLEFTLRVSSAELVLILKHLRASEDEAAKELDNRLSHLRASIVRQALKENDSLFRRLEEAGVLERRC